MFQLLLKFFKLLILRKSFFYDAFLFLLPSFHALSPTHSSDHSQAASWFSLVLLYSVEFDFMLNVRSFVCLFVCLLYSTHSDYYSWLLHAMRTSHRSIYYWWWLLSEYYALVQILGPYFLLFLFSLVRLSGFFKKFDFPLKLRRLENLKLPFWI